MGRVPVKVQIKVTEFSDASEPVRKLVGVTLIPLPPVIDTVTSDGRVDKAESKVGTAAGAVA